MQFLFYTLLFQDFPLKLKISHNSLLISSKPGRNSNSNPKILQLFTFASAIYSNLVVRLRETCNICFWVDYRHGTVPHHRSARRNLMVEAALYLSLLLPPPPPPPPSSHNAWDIYIVYIPVQTFTVLLSNGHTSLKTDPRTVSVVDHAIYDTWERLSSDVIRSFAVKFARYAENCSTYEHELTRFDLLVLSKFQIFLWRFNKNLGCNSKRFV